MLPLSKVSNNKNGRPRNSFLGWANHIVDRAKDIFTLKISKFAVWYLKFHKYQIPGLGKCKCMRTPMIISHSRAKILGIWTPKTKCLATQMGRLYCSQNNICSLLLRTHLKASMS